MNISSVDSITTSTNTASASNTSENLGTISTNDFLTLFVEQLKNQDPLEPMDNSEYITQLAQISLLEQICTLNEKIDSLIEIETDTNEQIYKSTSTLSNYSDMIGKSAYWSDLDGVNGSGLVDGIIQKEFKYYALINGEEVNIESVYKIIDRIPNTEENINNDEDGLTNESESI